MTRTDGGPAFPRPSSVCESTGREEIAAAQDGLSLRDYMAARALVALLGRDPLPTGPEAAGLAYSYADAMLAERLLK